MARFYSSYEMKKKDMQLKEDFLLNTQKYKNDLKDAINYENHRSNVDSAKKKAVNQHMDYDGFHQMVLGADLKGIKPNELTELKPESSIMNTVFLQQKFGDKVDIFKNNFVPLENNSNGEKAFLPIEQVSLNNFKKKWKSMGSSEDKVGLFKVYFQTVNEFLDILNKEALDADLFSEIFLNFGNVLLENKFSPSFCLDVLNIIVTNEQFVKLKKFLGKKHKQTYLTIEENKSNLFTKEEELLQFYQIYEKITK